MSFKEISSAVLAFTLLVIFIGFAIWLGAMLLIVAFFGSIFLTLFIFLRGYYLRRKYKQDFKRGENTQGAGQIKTTIIDVEYSDISNKKQ